MNTRTLRTLTAATVLALLLGACSSNTAATGADADAATDALHCGTKDAHFAEFDDRCANVAGCAIFKTAIPKCEPGAAHSCTCGECYGQQCVAQICWPCADVADAAVEAGDAVSQQGDATPASDP